MNWEKNYCCSILTFWDTQQLHDLSFIGRMAHKYTILYGGRFMLTSPMSQSVVDTNVYICINSYYTFLFFCFLPWAVRIHFLNFILIFPTNGQLDTIFPIVPNYKIFLAVGFPPSLPPIFIFKIAPRKHNLPSNLYLINKFYKL